MMVKRLLLKQHKKSIITSPAFIFTVNISSYDPVFQLKWIEPEKPTDIKIIWGDGLVDSISTWDDPKLTHTYNSSGIYDISIPRRVGSKSCYFNASNSYLTITMPGMQDYTFEWWMYSSINTAGVWIRANNGADYCNAGFGSGGYLVAFKDVTTTIANSAIPLNTWTHIAIQRQGTVGTIFINGIQQYQNNSVNTIYSECPMQFFGAHDLTDFKGYIDSLRVTSVARYSGNFIPNYVPHPIS